MDQIVCRAMEREDIERIAAWCTGFRRDDLRKEYAGFFDEQERGLRTVFVAEKGGVVLGAVSLWPAAKMGPFKGKGIPIIGRLTIREDFQGQGVGTELMNRAEAAAAETSDTVCLGVGVSGTSGAALRLFVKRGYIPDASGVWLGRSPARPDATLEGAGYLTLYMSRQLR